MPVSHAPAIRTRSQLIPLNGESLLLECLLFTQSSFDLALLTRLLPHLICLPRIPSNCAFTPQVHPESLTTPTRLTSTSPPNYHLLNSGLVVLKPSLTTMNNMIQKIRSDSKVDAYSFPDQDFLADFFKGHFNPLPWFYNSIKRVRTCHQNIWRDEEVRNIHYILDKPWVSGRPNKEGNTDDGQDKDDRITHGWWWNEWDQVKSENKLNLNGEQWQIVEEHVNQNSFDKR